jgi:helix-turn-helix protein
VSIRRACSVLEFDRSTFHYKSRRREQAGLEARIKEICAIRVRYGYRRVHVLLRREGWEINLKTTRRIYNELGLQLTSLSFSFVRRTSIFVASLRRCDRLPRRDVESAML